MLTTIPETVMNAPIESEKLNILSRNVRLLKFGDIDAFITRMSETCADWGFLLLQEFYSGAKVFPNYSQDGHRVFATVPHRGLAAHRHYCAKTFNQIHFSEFIWAP